MPSIESDRKRKSHKKSRQGCRNCKLRRVKCDETKPKCQKCVSFGVSCNYNNPKASDLDMTFGGACNTPFLGVVKMTKQLTPPYPTVADKDPTTAFQLDRPMFARLDRFQTRIVPTIGPFKISQLYQRDAIRLSCSHPYLMHVVQTVTVIHEHYLAGFTNARQMITDLSYHWSQGIRLFNQRLSSTPPISADDCDALWATAALSGIISFAAIEASTPEEAWPLKPSDPSDLDWLRMTEGKAAVWNLTKPLPPDSIFGSTFEEFHNALNNVYNNSSTDTWNEGLPYGFFELYNLENSTLSNPYYEAVRTLTPLLRLPCDQSNIIKFLPFMNKLQPEYRKRLDEKDPRAILLMAYWFAKVCKSSSWWMLQRSLIECQSICLYLERYHSDTIGQELLYFPKIECGLLTEFEPWQKETPSSKCVWDAEVGSAQMQMLAAS